MSTQEQARSLMVRHQQIVKNRQQSMLSRVASEIGLDGAKLNDGNHSSMS